MAKILFILGYYRSGTSALAGMLQRLGVVLHNDAEPNEHNPLGYYEIPELIELDVAIFARLGVDWTDVRRLPEGWAKSAAMAPMVTRLDEILRRRFVGSAMFGVKHPHLCRLLPLYEQVARQAGHDPKAIVISRDPWTVAASQQRKNGLSRAHALLLWVSHLVDAERYSRHLPRSWLTYHDLLGDPAAALGQIAGKLGLAWPRPAMAAAVGTLSGGLNRSVPVASAGLYAPLAALAEDLWAALRAGDTDQARWDGFAARCADLSGWLEELAASRSPAVAGFGAAVKPAEPAPLRPAERLDEGARQRLLARAAAGPALPRLGVLIAAPAHRAHAVNDTLAALRAQWREAVWIRIVAAETCAVEDVATVAAANGPGGVSATICAEINAARDADYVAILNAGDLVDPDAVLRFALAAAGAEPAMIYSDEVVEAPAGEWVRFKPAWDPTRLRQAAYLGDWVWYHAGTLRALGGFDPDMAGAEEYDVQLRVAEAGAPVLRLAEAVFRRKRFSRRDDLPTAVFGARAAAAVVAHCARLGLAGEIRPRRHLGLFERVVASDDPGTAVILICDDADIAALDRWMNALLGGPETTGPIILIGQSPAPPVAHYLSQVEAQASALRGKVLALPTGPLGSSLERAVALAGTAHVAFAGTAHVAIAEARSLPAGGDWLAALRQRLDEPGVVLAGGRVLIPSGDGKFTIEGPIVHGASARLGAGHLPEDPGPGGWLAVDQSASALAPPLLAARAALARCDLGTLPEQSFWAELGLRLGSTGGRLVWTPDVSVLLPDGQPTAGTGGVPGIDPWHHPALALSGDLLAPEPRPGLVRAAPFDPDSLLLSGPPDMPVLNAARAMRAAGWSEAGWAPEPLGRADIIRHGGSWIRINPHDVPPEASPYVAVFTRLPPGGAAAAIGGATELVATSPALVAAIAPRAVPGQTVTLWRPALSAPVWRDLAPAVALNSKPRLLWIDEGLAPAWFATLINETLDRAVWIVVERPGTTYSGAITRLPPPPDEQSWARELAMLAPHLLLRPVDQDASADHYPVLLAAAAGCHVLVDARLDLPAALRAVRLPNNIAAWRAALQGALDDLVGTLARGAAARAACLALPSLEAAPPNWAAIPLPARRCAAE